MRLLGFILTACLVLAAIRAAMIVVALLIGLGLIAMFIENPKGTLAAMVTIGGMSIFATYPGTVTIVVGIAAAMRVLIHAIDRSR